MELEHILEYLPHGLVGSYKLSDVIELSTGQTDENRNKILTTDTYVYTEFPYDLIQLMAKHHFDYMGLIDEKLAIQI